VATDDSGRGPCLDGPGAASDTSPANSDANLRELRESLARLRDLHDEAQAVIAHFEERPVITAEDATEEDARWIMRYDRVMDEYRRLGYAV